MSITRQGIGLLGGSFDPVHNGHIDIARSFINSGYINELWILLTPDPPHKTKRTLTSYDKRLEMLIAAFEDVERVKVSDVERSLPQPSYTVQTLKYLSNKYPDKKFHLCIGGDSLRDFKTWKDWKKILDYCDLLVARRPSERKVDLDADLVEQTHFVDHDPINISSTLVRKAVADGDDISELVPAKVQGLIREYNLYKD